MSALLPAQRLTPPDWMRERGTRAVMAALTRDAGAARFVGGCVRDTLLARAFSDIDIATPLLPPAVLDRLDAAGIRAVPTGLAHGTVTAVLPGRSFEITTLRRDVESFGRHARVAFTDDWAEDARRRDFTMNALFLDAEGQVFDAVGGLADLAAGRVRFVGDPATRIREDVLRLLRFYRFQAWYGRGPADAAARAAARDAAGLLPHLSGERIATELLKLLAAPDPLPALTLLREDGGLTEILPEAGPFETLARLIALEPTPDPLRRLAALIDGDGAAVAARLKFSGAQRERLAALGQKLDLAAEDRRQRRWLNRLGSDLYRDQVMLAGAGGALPQRVAALLALAETWQPIAFPLRGRDVTAQGVPPGPEVGELLATVEEWWEDGDFAADRRACLLELDRLLAARG